MKNKTQTKKVAVVGLWHMGSVYAACFAKMGFSVTAFDTNKKVITNFIKGIPPIFEPELKDTITFYTKNIHYTSSLEDLKNKDYIFITHDLAVDENDVAETGIMEKIFALVTKCVSPTTMVVISSQVPVGTSRTLVNLLKKRGVANPKVVYFPENLRLGTAFEAFLKPERIIIGSDNKEALAQFEKDIPLGCPVLTMGLESAEMVKHALNTYLATCISLSGELSDISEKVGANMIDVIKALKTDKRVSQHAPLMPGLGFAGGTLGRDIQSLRMVARKNNYKTELLDSVYAVNSKRVLYLVNKIVETHPTLKGKKIGILGLTYKANTDTLRRSMSLTLATHLKRKGALIHAFDPTVTVMIKEHPHITVHTSMTKFAHELDVIVLMTDWKDFLNIDVEHLAKNMKHKIVVDSKNFLDMNLYKKHGFTYLGVGIQ